MQKIDAKYTGLNKFNVSVSVDTIILFLWLEADTIDGKFEDNGFIVTEANFSVEFSTKDMISAKDLQKSITYQYYLH